MAQGIIIILSKTIRPESKPPLDLLENIFLTLLFYDT